MTTKSSRDGLGVGMFGYENLAVFLVKTGAEQEMMLLSAEQNMIMRAHCGDWG